MNLEITPPETHFLAGAIAIGAVCAILATLVLFPFIDRYVRPRFGLERGSAMVVLLIASLVTGLGGAIGGHYWLTKRQPESYEEPSGVQVESERPD